MANEKCRYVSTGFWDDEWIQTLDPSEKLLYLYLLTNPLTNIAGIYKITIRRMCFDTGFNTDTVGHILRKFEAAGKVFLFSEWIVLPNWPKHQKIGEKDNNRKGVDDILNSLPDDLLQFVIENKYNYAYLQDLPRCSKDPYKALISTSNYSNLNSNINSNTNPNQKRKPQAARDSKQEFSQDFLTFYDSYPRKEGKTAASKTYTAKIKQGKAHSEIMAALAVYKAQIEKKHTEPQYIKLPATFLNCFEDFEPQAAPPAPRRTRLVFKAGQVCKYCQKPLPQGMEFCPNCNADLSVGMDRDKYEEVEV